MKRPILHAVFVALVAACMFVTALSPAQGAGAAPVTFPKSPKGLKAPVTLPASIDPASPYAPQVSCSPVDMPGPTKLRELVMKTYGVGGRGNISRGCTQGISEHSEGRAWDWMVNVKNAKEKAAAADFLAWLTADKGKNARRLGVMYVIYNKKIWAIYRQTDGWRANSGHTDHMHISFGWAGARAKTSFWTGKVAGIDFGPCVRFKGQPAVLTSSARSTQCYTPTPLLKTSKQPTLQYGASNVALKKVQKALSISQTGRFDAATWQAIKAYQGRHDLPVTGAMDQPTWTSLFLDENKSTVVEGYTWLSSARHGLKYYYKGTLSESRTDKPVLVLQIALKMPRKDRNGYFGKLTKAAVIAMQKEAGLNQTGKVSKAEWEALVKLRS